MGRHPTDLGQDFIKKGMRLITQTSSDALMDNPEDKKRENVIIVDKTPVIQGA